MPADTLIDPLDALLGYQMRRAVFATMVPLVDGLATLDLKPTEAVILRLVHANPGCNQSQIGRSLGVQRTNMAPIIAGLVKRDLIERRKADGRTHALGLTEAGESLHARVVEIGEALERRFFGDVTSEQRSDLIALCQSVRSRASSSI